MKKEAIIFDLDGTIANISHRVHYLKDYENPDGSWNKKVNWSKFHNSISEDIVVEPIKFMLNHLYSNFIDIIILTGRNNSVKKNTVKWLRDNEVSYDHLIMRPKNDYRSDTVFKLEQLKKLEKKFKIHFIVEDRNRVVKMWRDEGYICLQCKEGDY
jgi:2-hydroxy-3-keto-5-methylthiopentenyl-1-phosphate phosphatase